MYSGSRLGLGLVHIDRRYKKKRNEYGFNFLPVVLLFCMNIQQESIWHPSFLSCLFLCPSTRPRRQRFLSHFWFFNRQAFNTFTVAATRTSCQTVHWQQTQTSLARLVTIAVMVSEERHSKCDSPEWTLKQWLAACMLGVLLRNRENQSPPELNLLLHFVAIFRLFLCFMCHQKLDLLHLFLHLVFDQVSTVRGAGT